MELIHILCHVLILIPVLLLVTACNDSPVTTLSPTPFFPQQRDARPDTMSALLVGELVLVDGCLRVNDSDGNNYLLVWPRGFSLRTKGNVIQVVDSAGQPVARVGDKLKVSGGEAPAEHIAKYSAQLPSGCPGPYWIVGSEINK